MKNHIIVLVIYVTFFTKFSVDSSSVTSPEINDDFQKWLKISRTNHNITISIDLSSEKPPRKVSSKKWQVGRVSRKQYEIVNMLWRKTKLFLNNEEGSSTAIDNTQKTEKPTSNRKSVLTLNRLQLQTTASTPSFIEFYYLDDNDERLKRRDALISSPNLRGEKQLQRTSRHRTSNTNINTKRKRYPIMSFYVNDPEFQFVVPPQMNRPNFRLKQQLRSKTFYDKQSMYDFLRKKLIAKNGILAKLKSALSYTTITTSFKISNKGETCPITFDIIHDNMPSHNFTRNNTNFSSSTELNDKIKFFEMYDQHTQLPDNKLNFFNGEADIMVRKNYVDSKQVQLEDINSNIGHHDGLYQKHVKKHINDDFKDHNPKINNNNDVLTNATIQMQSNNNKSNYQNSINKINISTTVQGKSLNYSLAMAKNASQPVLWSDYSFAAAYIYEPSQIHCDAAALSPHWLLASGACLSRYHRQDPATEGRSAFVCYCGEKWWQPERIIYVKYIVVHPQYHPKDEIRRYMFNIGLIQVAGSMASTCLSWRPVSIMSHHFVASVEGTLGASVGWGLDRYSVRYFRTHGPRVPLHIYRGLVYSSSCPGNTQYGYNKDFHWRHKTL